MLSYSVRDLCNNGRSEPKKRNMQGTHCPESKFKCFLFGSGDVSHWHYNIQELYYLLNLNQKGWILSTAYNLEVLNLEDFSLPARKGIESAAKLIDQQCLHLHFRHFSFVLCLDHNNSLETDVCNREKLKHEIIFPRRYLFRIN